MTITLTPQTEEKLKEMATREGRDPNVLADTLLTQILEEARRDFEESCAAIAEALASEPTEDMSLEECRTQFEANRAARHGRRESSQKAAA